MPWNKSLPSVAVIGSRGRMGTMLTQRLTETGRHVLGWDLPAPGDSEADLAGILGSSRIVLLCVPVGAMAQTLSRIRPYLASGHLLMDITSVKVLPMLWMEEAFGGAVIGTHPMFGPRPRPEDMRVALVRGKKATEADCADAARLFEDIGSAVFWSGAQEHDAGVALSQSLNFTVSAAYFAALSRHEGIEAYLTPSFRRHLESARMHLTEDTAMFLEFTAMNPEFPAALKLCRDILDEAAAGRLADVAAEASRWYGQPQDGARK